MIKNSIIIKGARENNLKNISLTLPKNKLIVFTGVSGSGKSSLAFNTIYEEGRRRYVDSLSSYARQFLGGTNKPLVDSIEGLSPSISIEQKTTHNNPRSTVGTVTEIYDYLRLLYARIGLIYCPNNHGLITSQSIENIVKEIYKFKTNTKLNILSPIVNNEKGTFYNLFTKLKAENWIRVRVNGVIYKLEDNIELDKNKKHNIEILIDRLILTDDNRSRLVQAIEIALNESNGLVLINNLDNKTETTYSQHHSCSVCHFNMPLIEPRIFSFNSPNGMCTSCKGLGFKNEVDPKKLMPNMDKSINQGGIKYFENLINTRNIEWQEYKTMLINSDIPLDMPLKNLSAKELDIITYGNNKKIKIDILTTSNTRTERIKVVEGLAQRIERRYLTTKVEMARAWYQKTFMSELNCKKCNGSRLNEYALAVKINNLNIYEFSQLSISQALAFILNLKLNDNEKEIATLIINELVNRLSFLSNVGLEYLTLIRKAETLSGGEAQRIRLATQIGSKLTGILYVLDEPSIGLHQKDNQKLISTLKHMVGIGNTLIVVEHDEETIRSADWIVDIGPLAGDRGGSIVAQGELKDIENESKSITGLFLSNKEKIDIPSFRRKPKKDKKLIISGAKENNLKNIDVEFPLGQIIAVTGVSGSGKSTLINEILAKALNQKLTNPFIKPGNFKEIKGIKNNVDKVIIISQSPIGRTPRSNPATYTSVFNDIRDLFAEVPLARERGYLKGRFSFNVPGGRCDKCYGDGVIEIEMHFLPNVYVKCTSCNGKRFNFETLECKYKNKSIYDVLEMRVSEALDFFENHPKIKEKLQTIVDVGLGYIKLGQNATTISGGEAQRVKLATYLQKKPTGKSIYILDEPTTGLHQYDIKKLLIVLNRLVDNGDTVIVIEHNLDVIKCVDYIIDLGPGGGIYGGRVVAKGTPEEVAKNKKSYTGQFLSEIFNKNKKS